jgi:eukaryotic-like serine/threonine-protein kinase
MTSPLSTTRLAHDSSVGDATALEALSAIDRVRRFWKNDAGMDVQRTIREFPSLVYEKSLLLDLVLEEFKARRRAAPELTVQSYCSQFQFVGAGIQQSIFRLLEVQDYLDRHPELLELAEDFNWPEPGDDIQGFCVVEELGRGALARVYLCSEREIGERNVVVKITRGGSYEATLLGRLDHPNIVPVYSVTRDDSRQATFICMPYRGRSTLLDVVDRAFHEGGIPTTPVRSSDDGQVWAACENIESKRAIRGPWSAMTWSYVDQVVSLMHQVADALAYSHAQGILHGDLKPSNILLTPKLEALLIDFNLAKDCRDLIEPCGGTLPYMAPEQLQHILSESPTSNGVYDVRSEVYSFGVVLYQMLTGSVPFPPPVDLDDLNAIASHLHHQQQQAVAPCAFRKNRRVNQSLQHLVQECLALDPANRPQSMETVRRRLRTQIWPAARLRRTTIAHPVLTRSIMASFISIGLGTTWYYSVRPPYVERQLAVVTTLEMQQEYKRALKVIDEILEVEPRNEIASFQRARTKMQLGNFDSAIEDFTAHSRAFGDPISTAYSGYCFNMRNEHAAAIDRYERAIQDGFETAGLHNNLGVSYQVGRSRIAYDERLSKAEFHLQRAVELDPELIAARRNLVILAMQRAGSEPDYDAARATRHLQAVLDRLPDDPGVWQEASSLFLALMRVDDDYRDQAIHATEKAVRLGGMTGQELLSPRFTPLMSDDRFEALRQLADELPPSERRASFSRIVDPVAESPR